MACHEEQWELRAPRRRKRKFPRRVSDKWLRRPVPDRYDLSEAQRALKIVADANLEKCLDELVNSRQNTACEAPVLRNRTLRRLNKQWSSLQSYARSQIQGDIDKEFGPNINMQPLNPDVEVKQRFFEARRTLEHTTTLTYHGTKAANIDSISRIGLLMPGKDGHKVANGSAHGVGIYTAKLGSPGLSKNFCDSCKMFVCAVCDSSQPVTEPDVKLHALASGIQLVLGLGILLTLTLEIPVCPPTHQASKK